VARAFAVFADATGNRRFLEREAWPVLSGVADFIVDRADKVGEGYGFREIGGPAEQKDVHDNDALSILAAKVMLLRAATAAGQLGESPPDPWRRVAEGLKPPMQDGVIVMHDGYRPDEEQGAAPSPLLALFPYWAPVDDETQLKTLSFWLERWQGFVGKPMMPALYATWACWAGARDLALTLLDEGYGRYLYPRFSQTLEYRLDKEPGGTAAGPFFANIGGFLSGLIFGMPGLCIDEGDPAQWPRRPVVLPAGWDAIEVERLWVRGRPMRLMAKQGDDRATLTEI